VEMRGRARCESTQREFHKNGIVTVLALLQQTNNANAPFSSKVNIICHLKMTHIFAIIDIFNLGDLQVAIFYY